MNFLWRWELQIVSSDLRRPTTIDWANGHYPTLCFAYKFIDWLHSTEKLDIFLLEYPLDHSFTYIFSDNLKAAYCCVSF